MFDSVIEEKLSDILQQVGILDESKHLVGNPYYVSQYEIGDRYYPKRCNGNRFWCLYQREDELNDYNEHKLYYCDDIDDSCHHQIHNHNPSDYSKNIITNPIRIGNNVWIGANSVICAGVTIGDNVIIGAGSVVCNDIPSNCVAVGSPCKKIKEKPDYEGS